MQVTILVTRPETVKVLHHLEEAEMFFEDASYLHENEYLYQLDRISNILRECVEYCGERIPDEV